MTGQDASPSRARARRWGIGALTTLTITIMVAASVDLTVMASDEKSAVRSPEREGRSGQNGPEVKEAEAPASQVPGAPDVAGELHVIPVAGRTPTVEVTNIGLAAPLPAGAVEEAVLRPNHPPLDQIPPMPMPRPEDGGVSATGDPSRIVWRDAKTGRTGIAPVQVTQQADFGQHSGYDGVDGGGGLDESDFGGVAAFVNMTEIANTAAFPWRMNVKVVMRFVDLNGSDRWFGCSGSMIDAETVALAGHCVYARTAEVTNIFDWAEEIWIYPGRHGSLDPYGWARGTNFATSTGWKDDGNFDWDWGLLRVTRSVGMLTGWFGTAWGFGCDTIRGRTYNNASYPGENCPISGLHNGADMYYWYGTFDSCPGNQLQINTGGGNCFDTLWGGQSGSGAYYMDGGGRFVHAVASNSNRTTSGRYAKLWESMFNYIYDDFIPAARTNSFDLQALDANAGPSSIPAGELLTTHTFLAANPTNAGASGTWTVRWYLSTNDDISSADRLIGTGTFDYNFAAMSSATVNVGGLIPADVPPGNYYWGVELDAGTDGNSSNNSTDRWDAVPITVTAARPSNDDCGDATLVPSVPFDPPIQNTSSATSEGSDPLQSCTFGGANDNSNSVWYRYTPTCNGTIDVSTCGSSYDTVVSVYTGSCGNFVEIGCNDDSCGLQSDIIGLSVAGGGTLYIEVTDFGAPGGGNLDFHLDFTPNVPANDACDAATRMSSGNNNFGTTCGATLDSAPLCFGEANNAPGVWYRVSGTGTMMTATTCSDATDYDTKISVYCANCGTLPCVAANDDNCASPNALASTLSWCSQYGNEYLILVHGFGSATGNFELSVSDDGVPCTGAVDCGGAEIGACCGADGGSCLGSICGEFSTCEDNGLCVCGFDTEGGGRCFFGGGFCALATPCPNGSVDCPTGQNCWAHSCCGGPTCAADCSAGSTADAGLEGGVVAAEGALRLMGTTPDAGSVAAAAPHECLSTTESICLAAQGLYLGNLTTCGGAAFVHRATVDNIFFNHTNIDHPLANGDISAIVMATQNWNPVGGGGGFKPAEIGVWYNPNENKWSIFKQDNVTLMPVDSAFNVEVLSASASVFVHTANTVIGHTTNIDHPLTNGNPDAIVMLTQNWNPAGDFNGVYNDHPIGVWYTGLQWSIFNEDIADMSQGASFNIEVLSASAGAFIHTATVNNIVGHWTVIDHPSSNGNPEALLHITQNWNPGGIGNIYNVAKTSVWYDGSNWAIFNENFADMPDGASFNVKVLEGGTSCPDPVGACCIDGACVGVLVEVECTSGDGTWFEDEDCATVNCPQQGACCAAQACTEGFICEGSISTCNGSFGCACLSTIEGGFACTSVFGSSCGDACTASSDCTVGWVCAVDTCCTAGPAVCVPAQCGPDGTVSAAASEVFASSGDESMGRIAGDVIPPVSGCAISDVETCSLVGGAYQGDNTICTDLTCEAPLGACCSGGACIDDMDEAACVSQGGTWSIHQDCSTVNCEQPHACCFATGGCQNMLRAVCLLQGGQPQGAGTDCRTHQCVAPEACCLSDGRCGLLSPNECRERGGTPLGPNSECLGDRDENGKDDACEFDQPCQDCGPGRHWIDECREGEDVMPSGAVIGIDRDGDCVQDLSLRLSGPVHVKRSDPLDDSRFYPGLRTRDEHLDVIDVEMVSMNLTGGGVRMIAGGGLGQGGVLRRSMGAIAEQEDDTLADSFFDVFFEVELGLRQYAYNQEPLRVQAKINCLPPVTTYVHPRGCIKLYDTPIPGEGRVVAWLVTADHTTYPGCGDPSAGDCYEPHEEPYCNDQVCCETVCERDPRCCSDSWKDICTEYAMELCPLVDEACCLPDGRCGMTDRRTCEAEGGVSQGPNSNCDIRCPLPQEACCFPSGGCDEMDPTDCDAQGGRPQGAGTSCANLTCPVPPEACCMPDGSCIDTAPVTCRLRNGNPQGLGTTCDTHRCPLPPQACCIDDTCIPEDPFICRTNGGVPQGPGTDCLGDANGNGLDDACDADTPCNGCGGAAHWIHEPSCPPGADNLPSGAIFGIDLNFDCIADTSVVVHGPATVLRSGPRDDSMNFPGSRLVDGHMEVIDTEMVSMELTNVAAGITLRAGAGRGAIPLAPSLGAILEQSATPELADSFFEMFVEVETSTMRLYNQAPLRVDSKIDCIPPDTDYIHPTGCIPLFDTPIPGVGTHLGNLVSARHSTFLDCGSASAGGCFEPNGTPFCDEAECCRLVCEQNEPDCCGVEWDATCASIAQDVCVAPEACCLPGGQCISIRPADCIRRGGVALGPRTQCEGDLDGDGKDDACQADDQCEDCGPGDHWIDTCPGGNDNMDTGAKIGLDFTLDCEPDRSLVLSGPVSIWHSPGREDSANFPGLPHEQGHFDVIDTEIVSMSLTNAAAGVTLRAGNGMGIGGTLPASLGAIVEQPGTKALGDSFFDVFFEVDVGGGLLAYNHEPLRVESKIDCLPPSARYIHPVGCIPLYDVPPGVTTRRVIVNLVTADHSTFPECGDDTTGECFIPNSTPYCDDADCCDLVCLELPQCCEIGWDDRCAELARDVCRPTEACCARDTTCSDIDPGQCIEIGGQPQGQGSNCSNTVCRVPPQACCLPGDVSPAICTMLSPDDCRSGGGIPHGPNTGCEGDANSNGVDDACEDDDQCEDCGPGDHWVDRCPGGNDNMATGAKIGLDLVGNDCVADMSMVLNGPVSVWRSGPRDDSVNYPGTRALDNHFDVIDTEMVALTLTNAPNGVTLRAGAGMGMGQPLPATLGVIAEQGGDTTMADSFFDVFFEVDIQGLLAYNATPLRVETKIDCLPPNARYIHPVGCIPLFDVAGNLVANLVTADHSTYPTCGDETTGDCFEPNGTPYCDEVHCCELVCTELPQCCDVGWDERCADLARVACGGECPQATIGSSRPADGTVDARQPSPVDLPLPRQGIGSPGDPADPADIREPILIRLDPPMQGAEQCFNLCETSVDQFTGPNAIQSVTYLGNGSYEIILRRAITTGAVTTIQYKGDGSFVEYTAHPANADGDSASAPPDILKIIDYLNGVATSPWGIYSEDIDRSNQLQPPDILRVIDLLNGAGAYDSWLNVARPVNRMCPTMDP